VGVNARYVWDHFPDRLLSFTGNPGQRLDLRSKGSSRKDAEPLTSLLLRCEKLAQMPLTARFVFDGPGRTSVKRGIQTCGAKIASQLAYLNYEQDVLRMAENGQGASYQMDE
jgi:hypothetical protein